MDILRKYLQKQINTSLQQCLFSNDLLKILENSKHVKEEVFGGRILTRMVSILIQIYRIHYIRK